MLFLFGWAASLSATSFLAAAKMGPRRALALIHMLPSNFDLKLYREHMSCRCFTVGAITHPPVWQHAHGQATSISRLEGLISKATCMCTVGGGGNGDDNGGDDGGVDTDYDHDDGGGGGGGYEDLYHWRLPRW
eukprot:1161653-Pelagomonas_calceolata.AAC.11